jgi:CrcB protein
VGSLGDAALVGLGGALGSIGRWLVGLALASSTFPYGTLTVNVTGAFVAGGLIGLADGRGLATPSRLALVTGFCGGYTTFSAFAVETLRLAEQQGTSAAALNVAANLVIGLVAAGAGIALGRAY